MDIKCTINPNYFQNFPENRHRVGNDAGATFQGAYRVPQSVLKENVDKKANETLWCENPKVSNGAVDGLEFIINRI